MFEVMPTWWNLLELVRRDELQWGGVSPCFDVYRGEWAGSSHQLPLTTAEEILIGLKAIQAWLA